MQPSGGRAVRGPEFVSQLVDYTRRHAADILSGSVKLTLQPKMLAYLNSHFPRSVSDGSVVSAMGDGRSPMTTQKEQAEIAELYAFFQSIPGLRIAAVGPYAEFCVEMSAKIEIGRRNRHRRRSCSGISPP